MSKDTTMKALNEAGASVDDVLKTILAKHRTSSAGDMYDMLGYFFGFLDADLKRTEGAPSGKRFRPALCLLIADGYGAGDKAQSAALAIELFHNFTLIHDDVEDHSEYRRNRPTLSKLFGVNHAINSGDLVSLIACELASNTEQRVMNALFAAFREVIEGQYMDFELTSLPIGSDAVSVKQYMISTEKKTGALFGVAAEAAGMCAGQSELLIFT